MNIPLKTASKIALQIVSALTPYCHKVEIAGSIRRRREVVHDIDIVCMPSDIRALRLRATQKAKPIAGGDSNFTVELPNGIQVDLFFTRPKVKDLVGTIPSNHGSVLLCRTGSKEHNIWICKQAELKGLTYSPYKGLLDASGNIIAGETEASIFKALDLAFVKPEDREK